MEKYVGWTIQKWLFSARQSLICKWDDYRYFLGSCCRKPSIKFLLKRIYDLQEDVGWRKTRWLFSARQSLICKWDDLNISESPCCPKPSTKFLLKRIYGLEDVGWRIPRWLFSARQSLICKWYDFSYFQTSMLHKTFHQVFAQEDIWFGRRCWLKNSKMTA